MNINELIRKGECQTVEFKESFNSSCAKEICSFANSDGGNLIIGVKDDGTIKGFNLTNKIASQIQNIGRAIDPHIKLEIEQINNLVLIKVPESLHKPHSLNGSFYLRIGANSQKLTTSEIGEMFRSEQVLKFDEQIQGKFRLDDIDSEVYSKFISKLGLDLPKEKLLENLGLSKNGILNNSAVLLFAKDIGKYIPQAMIQCFLYQGKDKYKILDNKDFKSDLLSNYDQAIKYLQANLHTEFIIGKVREEKLEIPLVALREALINAMVHRDYFATPSIYVNIFQDRVEIVNAGGLPKRVSVNDLYLSSRPRNHLLFEIFQRLGLVERAGSGLIRINDSLKKQGLNPIKIDATEMTFRVRFDRSLKGQSDTINDTIKSKTDLIFKFVISNSGCSAVQISKKTKIPIATVKRHLKKLEDRVEYKGSKKSGGYYVK